MMCDSSPSNFQMIYESLECLYFQKRYHQDTGNWANPALTRMLTVFKNFIHWIRPEARNVNKLMQEYLNSEATSCFLLSVLTVCNYAFRLIDSSLEEIFEVILNLGFNEVFQPLCLVIIKLVLKNVFDFKIHLLIQKCRLVLERFFNQNVLENPEELAKFQINSQYVCQILQCFSFEENDRETFIKLMITILQRLDSMRILKRDSTKNCYRIIYILFKLS